MRITRYLIVLAAMLAASAASAQVLKCKGPNGQTVYSDRPCEDGSTGREVSVNANTVDGSYDRQRAEVSRMRSLDEAREREVSRLYANPPSHCKFAYFAVGDNSGKELARQARRECVENIVAEREGRPTSMRHYQMWNDHHNRQNANRQKGMDRAAAMANKPMGSRSQPADYTCRPSVSGSTLECRPR